jgi:hypothetical protein
MMNNNSYKAQTAKARSWAEIENHYLDLINSGWKHEPMLELVRYIRQTDLSERLYGYTSFVDKLVLSLYNPIEWNREALHISHNQLDKWTFEYYALPPSQTPEVIRNYASELGIEKFKDFIENKIKW